jgi:hypothetical protein
MTYIGPTNGSGNTPDPNVVEGWTVQGSAAQTALSTGTVPAGYAEPRVGGVPSVFTGNGAPGAPNPVPGNVASILTNPGYADVNVSYLTAGMSIPASIVPVPASGTAFTNPTSMDCTVVISGGEVTSVMTAAYGGDLAEATTNEDGSYTVPAGGQIELEYATAPTWTWTTARTVGAA